jgi:hypothetical protein
MTESELKVMAAAAIIGLSKMPNSGCGGETWGSITDCFLSHATWTGAVQLGSHSKPAKTMLRYVARRTRTISLLFIG